VLLGLAGREEHEGAEAEAEQDKGGRQPNGRARDGRVRGGSGLIDGKLQALLNRRVASLNGCEF
jgi:hypothetical protein